MLFVFDSQLFNNNGAIDGWNLFFRCHRINNKKTTKSFIVIACIAFERVIVFGSLL